MGKMAAVATICLLRRSRSGGETRINSLLAAASMILVVSDGRLFYVLASVVLRLDGSRFS